MLPKAQEARGSGEPKRSTLIPAILELADRAFMGCVQGLMVDVDEEESLDVPEPGTSSCPYLCR